MTRKLSFILIFSLLAVQLLSPVHMARHGFDKHEHNGKLCDIYLHSKHQQHSDDATPAALAESITYIAISYSFISQTPVVSTIRETALARAPPVLS